MLASFLLFHESFSISLFSSLSSYTISVFTFEDEHTSPVPPTTLYKALVFDASTVLLKVDEAIKSIETLEGNGDAGAIKKMTFVKDDKTNYAKSKVDAIDKDNFMYNYNVIESNVFLDYYNKISYETKLVPAPNGAIVKGIVKIFTKGNAPLKEEDAKYGREKGEHLFKAIEAYLLANPKY